MTTKQMIPCVLVLILILMGGYYLNTNRAGEPVKGQEGLVEPREDSRGMVTIAITYFNPTGSQFGDSPAFLVTMDTHSVDLDAYELSIIAYLKTANGKVIKPDKWEEADGSGGHHRRGILSFPMTDARLDQGNFDIIVEGLAGIDQRIFSW